MVVISWTHNLSKHDCSHVSHVFLALLCVTHALFHLNIKRNQAIVSYILNGIEFLGLVTFKVLSNVEWSRKVGVCLQDILLKTE